MFLNGLYLHPIYLLNPCSFLLVQIRDQLFDLFLSVLSFSPSLLFHLAGNLLIILILDLFVLILFTKMYQVLHLLILQLLYSLVEGLSRLLRVQENGMFIGDFKGTTSLCLILYLLLDLHRLSCLFHPMLLVEFIIFLIVKIFLLADRRKRPATLRLVDLGD
jgi:hypothetical protein